MERTSSKRTSGKKSSRRTRGKNIFVKEKRRGRLREGKVERTSSRSRIGKGIFEKEKEMWKDIFEKDK